MRLPWHEEQDLMKTPLPVCSSAFRIGSGSLSRNPVGGLEDRWPFQLTRSASVGSMRMARRAGPATASRPTTIINAADAATMPGILRPPASAIGKEE